ncbi:hypothetical protein [Rhodococcus sp. OK302]|uniref:hypothetical protein n=1 Tax=Rhodococcus sp. OK302 TaxID=1882769 RepID=UPI000B93F059|nr:hypothetical protein [Rhodococcus sp. OK302]OYD71648.1 hypothetical protein BDB13_5325 [Rhodococcus sp. OK302]
MNPPAIQQVAAVAIVTPMEAMTWELETHTITPRTTATTMISAESIRFAHIRITSSACEGVEKNCFSAAIPGLEVNETASDYREIAVSTGW